MGCFLAVRFSHSGIPAMAGPVLGHSRVPPYVIITLRTASRSCLLRVGGPPTIEPQGVDLT